MRARGGWGILEIVVLKEWLSEGNIPLYVFVVVVVAAAAAAAAAASAAAGNHVGSAPEE